MSRSYSPDSHPPSARRGESPHRIVGLDGLRAISIVLVIVGHGWATVPHGANVEWIGTFPGNAALGVTTFFVISGYLITYLLRTEMEKSGTINLRNFYIRRICRIFPAMYTYLIVLALLCAVGYIATTPGDLMAAAAFSTNCKQFLSVSTNADYWFVGHFWTLSLEEQFYLLWPVTLLLLGLSRAAWLAVAIVLSSPAIRIATYFLLPSVRPQMSMMLHTAADPIMCGCLAALWRTGSSHPDRLRRPGFAWVTAAAIFFLAVASPALSDRFHGLYSMTVGRTLEAMTVTYLLLWVVGNPGNWATRMLSTQIVRHVGLLSYSLYLWQQLFLTPRTASWVGGFPCNLLCCFAAAELSYWMIERPFLRMRDRFRQKPVAPADGVSVPGPDPVGSPAGSGR